MKPMTTNMYYSIKSLVGDLIALYKTAVPVPDLKTECRRDIQVRVPLSTQLSSLPAILGNSLLSSLNLITPITI